MPQSFVAHREDRGKDGGHVRTRAPPPTHRTPHARHSGWTRVQTILGLQRVQSGGGGECRSTDPDLVEHLVTLEARVASTS